MTDDEWRTAILEAAASGSGNSKPENSPIVPLWQVRPANAPRPARRGAMDDVYHGQSVVSIPDDESPKTAAYAEAYWMDMEVGDRQKFAEQAQKAGLWKPQQGAEGLANAWSKAVSSAASYNATHDQDKWISPWEAVHKLAIQSLADEGASLDGYTRTTTQSKQFSTDELYQTARSVLQQELGRDPSDSELDAYTIAVNRASAAHPQTTVTSYGPVDPNTGERTSVAEVQGPGFDPTQTIMDAARDAPDREGFMASQYLAALMNAIGAPV